jgi:dihydrofolate synthase/folylpolyglutamate synthase
LSEHISSPQETWDYINGLERLGVKLGLERVTKLVKELGSPHQAYKTIHVVGTNGKTSTTRFISSLLEAQGHTVGAYVSPHMVSLAERQMVGSEPSTEDEFCELVARVRPAVEKVERSLKGAERLTQFEVLTAAALLYFKEKGCDVAVIEAGLGGRLDATAVISSDVQVLTSIGREHTELLGDTLSKILAEKAAVIPQKGRVVVGALAEDLKGELRAFCAARAAECYFLGEQFAVLADPRAESFDISGIIGCYTDVRLKVLGAYQRVVHWGRAG